MSGWQELRAERNRRSALRLNKALPLDLSASCAGPGSCPPLRAADAAACHRVRTGVPIQSAPIAWREHLRLAAKRPAAGLGGSGTAGAACPLPSVRHPRHTAKPHAHSGRDFAACAVNQFIASAGTLTSGAVVPTRTRSGTALAWSPGSSGMRQVSRSDCCGASKVAAALKVLVGCGGMPKLTTASRCFGFGANTGTLPWPKLLDFWGLPNLQVINRDIHAAKCAVEAAGRRAVSSRPSEPQASA